MSANGTLTDAENRVRVHAELQREAAARQRGYRERALRLLPHVCASCSREFTGKRLRELTVHHRDHNHDNNPPDGSNWELLCMYCHDHEHEKSLTAASRGGAGPTIERKVTAAFQPFAALDVILQPKPGDADKT